jgi:enoyl-CoA hydratase
MADDGLVLRESADGITRLTLNRPEHLNALSSDLKVAIVDAFLAAKEDEATRVIILTGAGRGFCAGLDLKELGTSGLGGGAHPSGIDLVAAVRGVGKPVIGAINGFAITGGFELALLCDILVGSSEARFADTHVRMGVVPGWGLSQRLAQLIGASRAKELSFTGNYLTAEKAERWGLINDVTTPDELLPHCERIAADIVSVNQSTLRTVRHLIDHGQEHSIAEGMGEEIRLGRENGNDLTPSALERRRLSVQERGRDLNR